MSEYPAARIVRTAIQWWLVRLGKRFVRLTGCLLVATMPAEGLGETMLLLRDYWDFWGSRSEMKFVSPPLPIESVGKVIESRIRPDLRFEE